MIDCAVTGGRLFVPSLAIFAVVFFSPWIVVATGAVAFFDLLSHPDPPRSIDTDAGGLVSTPVKSASDCASACCSGAYMPNCTMFLWADFNDPAHWKENITCGCYLGTPRTLCKRDDGPGRIKWVGGRRTTPAPPLPQMAFSTSQYDDASWAAVQLPHDFVVEGRFSPAADDKRGYLPRSGAGWYRKHFDLPDGWSSSQIVFEFDGAFHTTQAWLNGKALTPATGRGDRNGYTSFAYSVPASQLEQKDNVLALRCDASFGSGHWYEGGGLYRHVRIVRVAKQHIVMDSLNAVPLNKAPNVWQLPVSIEVTNTEGAASGPLSLRATLLDQAGKVVATESSDAITIRAEATVTLNASTTVQRPLLWSNKAPNLYTMTASLVDARGATVDSVSTDVGFRFYRFDADTGFHLNGESVNLRGFSDHNDMGGVGSAVPARLNLYRGQMVRAVGGNNWRMSHNPGDPAVYRILSHLGVFVWDENRDYGPFQVEDMRAMVRRDRNHPSVVIWSFCNEIECLEQTEETSRAFRKAAKAADPSRPVSANLLHDSSSTILYNLDVVGVSHESTMPYPWTPIDGGWYDPRYSFDWFHEHHPSVALVSSESSSCSTQRGENVGNLSTGAFSPVFNADCLSKYLCPPNTTKSATGCTQSWTMAYNDAGVKKPFLAGTLGIWTLFDYRGRCLLSVSARGPTHALGPAVPGGRWHVTPPFTSHATLGGSLRSGEPAASKGVRPNNVPAWPQVSCNFGSFDLAGFSKPAAWHYRAWWLANMRDDAGAPPICPNGCDVVHIVHDWDAASPPPFVAVYSNLPLVELFLNGQSQGTRKMTWANWTQWDLKFVPGNLTAVAMDASGAPMARHTVATPGAPVSLRLSLDAPSIATGTGSTLVADGQDAGMVRAEVVDAKGNLVTSSSHNISFTITSPTGRILGVNNGDPGCHEPDKASWRSAYHGLARAVVQVTQTLVQSAHLGAYKALNPAGTPFTSFITAPSAVENIVVQASASGLKSASLTLPVSGDLLAHGVSPR